MLASLINVVQITELIAVTLATGGGIGIGIGRFTKRAYKTRREEDQKFLKEHQEIIHSLTGTPADQWGPAKPGLIDAMAQVQSLYADLAERTTDNEEWILEHERRHRGQGSEEVLKDA